MATITGDDRPNVLSGTDSADTIRANGGDDRVSAGGGGDFVLGGLGNDDVDGGPGNDNLDGESGADTLRGGEGNDNLDGGLGNDILFGQGGDDRVQGRDGNDLLVGADGGDVLFGEAGNDVLVGGTGSDALYGGLGDDWLNPGTGAREFITGDDGLDTLVRDVPVRLAPRFFPNLDASSDDFTGTHYGIEAFEFVDGRYTKDVSDLSAQALRLYQAAFGRAPDAGGLSFHVERLADGAQARPGGTGLAGVAADFVASAEFAARYAGLDGPALVAQVYRNVLGREGDAGGVAFWTGELPTRGAAGVLVGFSESGENVERTRSSVLDGLWVNDWEAAQVLRLYDTVYGRLPDSGGLAFWDAQLESGARSLREAAAAFVEAPEFVATYGSLGDRGFVEALYRNTLDRAPDATGVDFWVGQLPSIGRSGVVLGFSESAEHVGLTMPSMRPDGFLLSNA